MGNSTDVTQTHGDVSKGRLMPDGRRLLSAKEVREFSRDIWVYEVAKVKSDIEKELARLNK